MMSCVKSERKREISSDIVALIRHGLILHPVTEDDLFFSIKVVFNFKIH